MHQLGVEIADTRKSRYAQEQMRKSRHAQAQICARADMRLR